MYVQQPMRSMAQTAPEGSNIFPAQSVRVQATATVLDNLVLANIRDVNLASPATVNGMVTVNPVNSQYAGLMRLQGMPGKFVRITYLTTETLIEQNGTGGFVKARYQLSGFDSDNQFASRLLDAGEAIVRLGADGRYFIWLGAVLDLNQAKPGVYNSEFVIEVESN